MLCAVRTRRNERVLTARPDKQLRKKMLQTASSKSSGDRATCVNNKP